MSSGGNDSDTWMRKDEQSSTIGRCCSCCGSFVWPLLMDWLMGCGVPSESGRMELSVDAMFIGSTGLKCVRFWLHVSGRGECTLW